MEASCLYWLTSSALARAQDCAHSAVATVAAATAVAAAGAATAAPF